MNDRSERLPTSRKLERLQPQHSPRLLRRSHLPPRIARVLRELLNQRPVRIRLRPIRQIKRVLQPRAQVPAQFHHALVHGPDLAAADDGGLPGGVFDLELEQDGQQVWVGGHAALDAHQMPAYPRSPRTNNSTNGALMKYKCLPWLCSWTSPTWASCRK